MITVRRPLLVGALAASVVTLVASAAMAVGTLGNTWHGAFIAKEDS